MTGSPTRQDAGKQAIDERLDHFLTLQKDWDSYGGDPIDPECAAAARWIAHTLIAGGSRMENLQAVPCSDGTVQLTWSLNGAEIEIEVFADRRG